MYKRAREEEEEDGEITNTQILDELSMLKDEVGFLREEKAILSRQYADAADQRDKYKSRLARREEGAKKWKGDLEDESLESMRTEYAELKYEMESKKEKWKSERNKWSDRVERLEVKVEALKEENHKLVVMETRLRSDFERRLLSTTSEQRYKDQIKHLEESLKHSEVAFRAADALQREQEAITETMKANVKHIEELMRSKDEKITALQMAASRAAQQLADANALDHAAHQKSSLEKSLQAANNKFHEQIKVDAQKITSLTNDLSEKNRLLSEQKNATIHTAAKLQMLENSEKTLRDEIARLADINSKLVFADEQARFLHADNQSLTQQLAFRNGGGSDVMLVIDTLKNQNCNLTSELARVRTFAQEYELERGQLLEEIQVLRHGKGLGPRNGMARGTFANMQLRLSQLGTALGLVGPPGTAHVGPGMVHNNGSNEMATHGIPSPPNNYSAQGNANIRLSPASPPSESLSPTPAGQHSPSGQNSNNSTPPMATQLKATNNSEINNDTIQQEARSTDGTG